MCRRTSSTTTEWSFPQRRLVPSTLQEEDDHDAATITATAAAAAHPTTTTETLLQSLSMRRQSQYHEQVWIQNDDRLQEVCLEAAGDGFWWKDSHGGGGVRGNYYWKQSNGSGSLQSRLFPKGNENSPGTCCNSDTSTITNNINTRRRLWAVALVAAAILRMQSR